VLLQKKSSFHKLTTAQTKKLASLSAAAKTKPEQGKRKRRLQTAPNLEFLQTQKQKSGEGNKKSDFTSPSLHLFLEKFNREDENRTRRARAPQRERERARERQRRRRKAKVRTLNLTARKRS
jgi:hypothetical protein